MWLCKMLACNWKRIHRGLQWGQRDEASITQSCTEAVGADHVTRISPALLPAHPWAHPRALVPICEMGTNPGSDFGKVLRGS